MALPSLGITSMTEKKPKSIISRIPLNGPVRNKPVTPPPVQNSSLPSIAGPSITTSTTRTTTPTTPPPSTYDLPAPNGLKVNQNVLDSVNTPVVPQQNNPVNVPIQYQDYSNTPTQQPNPSPVLPPTQTQPLLPETIASQNMRQETAQVAPEPNTRDLQIKALQDQILASQAPGTQETELQKQINALQAQQAALDSSFQQGLLDEQGRPIALNFITGRQAQLEQLAGARGQAIAAQTVPLTTQLAQLQAQREAQANRATTQLGFQNDAASANAPQIVESGGRVFSFDPATNKLTPLADAQAEAPKPITVNEGQTLIDPVTRDVIYQAGKTISPYEEQKLAIERQNQSNSGDTKNLSADQAKTRQFAISAEAGNNILSLSQYDPGYIESGLVPNVFKSNARQQFEQAARAFVNSVLRRESGAVISDDEFKNKFKELIPQAGDGDAVKQQKAQARANAVASLREGGLLENQSNGVNQQEIDAARAQGYSDEDIQRFIQSQSFSNESQTSLNGLGDLAQKFESGGNISAIGYDSTGGYSFGKFQLANNNPIAFVQQSQFKNQFPNMNKNTKAFQDAWKNVAREHPQEFEQEQDAYIKKTHYDPQVQKLAQVGFNLNNASPALKQVVFSTAVQHGPATDVITKAIRRVGTTNESSLINEIYKERSTRFGSSTPSVQKSVQNRLVQERNLALNNLA